MENKFLLRGKEYLCGRGKHDSYIEKCGRYLHLIENAKSVDVCENYKKTLKGASFWACYDGDVDLLSRSDKIRILYSNSEFREEHLKKTLESNTPEVVERRLKNLREYYTKLTDEERKKHASSMCKGRKEWYDSLTDKDRELLSKKSSDSLKLKGKEWLTNNARNGGLSNNNRSDIDKELSRKKRLRENLSLETRAKMSLSQRKRFDNWTEDEKREHTIASKAGWEGKEVSQNHISKGEHEMFVFVQSICKDAVPSYWDLLKDREIDIWIPSKNVAIEFAGGYWHSDIKGRRNHHRDMYERLNNIGVHWLCFHEAEWIHNRLACESIIKNILSTSERVFARNCIFKEIDNEVKSDFIRVFHIQGNDLSFKSFGLFMGDSLVAVMTFRKSRNNLEIELSRYVTSCKVVGGFSKLLKNALTYLNTNRVVSYSDNRLFTGEVYSKCGFVLDSEISPDYSVVYGSRLYHKSSWRKSNILKKFPRFTNLNLTEWQMEDEIGALRVWDCGKKKWVFNLKPL